MPSQYNYPVNHPVVLSGSGTTVASIFIGGNVPTLLAVFTPGAATALTLNDCTTLGAATPGNQIYSIPATALQANTSIAISTTTVHGLVVSAVPSDYTIFVNFG
jgi:hypothetical protein